MLTDLERKRLEMWYEEKCQQLKIDSDLFDFEAKVDSNITIYENQTIIEQELKRLSEDGTLHKEQLRKQKAEEQLYAQKEQKKQDMKIIDLFDKPKVITLTADVNEGKSMALYHIIDQLKARFEFNLYSYGLKISVGEQKVYSVQEIERITNSIIIIDEFYSLFDLEDRKQRKNIERTLRHINHNNNILVLVGLPENFKKFISAKTDVCLFKRCTLNDFINGSRIKDICTEYKGDELGSKVLDIPVNKVMVFDGKHYGDFTVPYNKDYDTKKNNIAILRKCAESVQQNVQKVK